MLGMKLVSLLGLCPNMSNGLDNFIVLGIDKMPRFTYIYNEMRISQRGYLTPGIDISLGWRINMGILNCLYLEQDCRDIYTIEIQTKS